MTLTRYGGNFLLSCRRIFSLPAIGRPSIPIIRVERRWLYGEQLAAVNHFFVIHRTSLTMVSRWKSGMDFIVTLCHGFAVLAVFDDFPSSAEIALDMVVEGDF